MRRMKSAVVVAVAAVAIMGLAGGRAGAITNGQVDGNRHPNVGALLADYDSESPGPDILCSGTLIAAQVFLSAGHCTAFLEEEGISDVWVTFAPEYNEDSTSPAGLFSGTYHTHPRFGEGSNTFDVAAVVLDRSPAAAPAQLPRVGLLGAMKKQLGSQRFTTVGYGTSRDDPKRRGPNSFFFDGVRRFAHQSYSSLTKAWLNMSMNPSKGDGGTCFGDSGGPHFLGGVDSNLIVSVTVTGDAVCRASDKTYRVDTPWARDFLEQFPGVQYPGRSSSRPVRRP
jgi:secreted trypsin-like serine protease